MNKSIIFRNIWLGLLSWFIPFAISFFCYNQHGELMMEYSLFKSLMMVSGSLSGSFLLYQFFKIVDSNFVLNGLIVGLSWMAINLVLDSFVLIPLMKVTFAKYFSSIGLGYISIPAISISMGYLLNNKLKINSYENKYGTAS
jgi:uncharacterized membrane protein YpjA